MADQKPLDAPDRQVTSIETTPAADPAGIPATQRHPGSNDATGDDIIYTKDAQTEKTVIPESSSLDSTGQKKSDKDEEAGESYPKRAFYRLYSKYIKHVVYAVIWLLFTG